jgi:hypothetical protein
MILDGEEVSWHPSDLKRGDLVEIIIIDYVTCGVVMVPANRIRSRRGLVLSAQYVDLSAGKVDPMSPLARELGLDELLGECPKLASVTHIFFLNETTGKRDQCRSPYAHIRRLV